MASGGTLPDGAGMGAPVRVSFRMLSRGSFAMSARTSLIGLAVAVVAIGGSATLARAQAAPGPRLESSSAPAEHPSVAVLPDNPVADPKAIVTLGHARFTVLT